MAVPVSCAALIQPQTTRLPSFHPSTYIMIPDPSSVYLNPVFKILLAFGAGLAICALL